MGNNVKLSHFSNKKANQFKIMKISAWTTPKEDGQVSNEPVQRCSTRCTVKELNVRKRRVCAMPISVV